MCVFLHHEVALRVETSARLGVWNIPRKGYEGLGFNTLCLIITYHVVEGEGPWSFWNQQIPGSALSRMPHHATFIDNPESVFETCWFPTIGKTFLRPELHSSRQGWKMDARSPGTSTRSFTICWHFKEDRTSTARCYSPTCYPDWFLNTSSVLFGQTVHSIDMYCECITQTC